MTLSETSYSVIIIIKYNIYIYCHNHMVLYGALQYNNNNKKSTEKLKYYNIQFNNLKAEQQIVVN